MTKNQFNVSRLFANRVTSNCHWNVFKYLTFCLFSLLITICARHSIAVSQISMPYNYLQKFPTATKVISMYQGTDGYDVSARQCGALKILVDLVYHGTNTNLSDEEKKYITEYESEYSHIYNKMNRVIFNKYPYKDIYQWDNLINSYSNNDQFVSNLLSHYLTNEYVNAYLGYKQKSRESLAKNKQELWNKQAKEEEMLNQARLEKHPVRDLIKYNVVVNQIILAIMLAIGFYITVGIPVFIFKGQRSYQLSNEILKVSNSEFKLQSIKGKVIKIIKTPIYNFSKIYNGTTSNFSINASTIINDDIYIIDDEGKEHLFRLTGFDVACREDNYLSFISATKLQGGFYPNILVLNQTNKGIYYNLSNLLPIFAHPWIRQYGYAIIFLIITIPICVWYIGLGEYGNTVAGIMTYPGMSEYFPLVYCGTWVGAFIGMIISYFLESNLRKSRASLFLSELKFIYL